MCTYMIEAKHKSMNNTETFIYMCVCVYIICMYIHIFYENFLAYISRKEHKK